MEGGKAHGSSRHLSFLGFVQTNTRFHIEDQSDTKTTKEEDNGGICSFFLLYEVNMKSYVPEQ